MCVCVCRLAAYVVAAFVFLSGYVPPIMGMSDGPHRAHMSGQHAEEVRKLLLVALICTGVLQLCARNAQARAANLAAEHDHTRGMMNPTERIMRGGVRFGSI